MAIRARCIGCRRNKWFVYKRSYLAPTVSARPITSDGSLCYTCFDNIRFATVQYISGPRRVRMACAYLVGLIKRLTVK